MNLTQIASVVAILANVATVLMPLLGAVAFWQLKLAKDALRATRDQLELASDSLRIAKRDTTLRNERESVVLTAELCERFARLIPAVSDKLNVAYQQGVPDVSWELLDAEFSASSLSDSDAAADWVQKAQPHVNVMADVLNDCEAIALYFVHGAADERIAYPAISALYCEWVRRVAPILVSLRQGEGPATSGPYQNTVSLFAIWSSRMQRDNLKRESEKLQSRISRLPEVSIRPIGVEHPM